MKEVVLEFTDEKYYVIRGYLRDRYGKRKSMKSLCRRAISEMAAMQAKEELESLLPERKRHE